MAGYMHCVSEKNITLFIFLIALSYIVQICQFFAETYPLGIWRLKVLTFIYHHLQRNPNNSGLQITVVYWPALAVGGAEHLESANCLNEWTLDLRSSSKQAYTQSTTSHFMCSYCAGYSSLSSLSRQDAVVLRRLCIGHTRLTHSYLLNRQDRPECSHCDCALTVACVLLECNHYNVVRQRYFNISSLHELFDTVNAQNILGFIRDIGLYRLL